MSSILPTYELKGLLNERQTARGIWETEFGKNYKTLAEGLAASIAKNVIEKFGEVIKNPYKASINADLKITATVCLDITKSSHAQEVTKLAPTGAALAPFNEWLSKFSIKQLDAEYPHYETRDNEIDRDYFQDLMSIVGELAATKLNEHLRDFKAVPEHAGVAFSAKWIRKEDVQFSSFFGKNNSLHVELWLEKDSQPSTPASPLVIEQYRKIRMERGKLVRGVKVIIAIVIAIVGVIFAPRALDNVLKY